MAVQQKSIGNGISQKPQNPVPVVADKRPRNNSAFGCAILASMTTVLLGYDIAVMSGASLFIQDDLHITDVQVEVVAGIINLYSIVGSAAAGKTSDWIGRRYTLFLGEIIFFAGSILMAFAPNYSVLMLGRFLAGVSVGLALSIAPVYTAELSPAASRGFLTSLTEVFFNVGVLLGYILNYVFSKVPEHLSWRLMLGVVAIPAIILGLAVLTMPESPRWLVLQGRLGDAKRVLYKTSGTKEEAELRLAQIKSAADIPQDCNDEIIAVPKQKPGEGVWMELLIRPSPSVRRVLIAAVGIHFFQQSSGIDAVVLYSPHIFEKAGIRRKNVMLLATVAVGFVKTIFVLVATFLLDRIGRRPLLLTSVAGMIVSLVMLGFGLTMIDHSDKRLTWAITVSIASVLTFVACFSMGLGPIAWVYGSEIFPLRLRAQGASIGAGVNRVTAGVISMTFISLYKAMTIGGSFFLFTGVAVAAWVFFYFFLPETRGKTLEEMEELFGNFEWQKPKKKKENGVGISDQVELGIKG